MEFSIFLLLISFRKFPWYFLTCSVQENTTKQRGYINVNFIKCKKNTEDYCLLSFYSQNCDGEWSKLFLFLFLWDRTTKRYIVCYFPLTYNDYLIVDMFYIKTSCSFVFITNIESMISWYFMSQFLNQSKNSIKFDCDQQQHSKTQNSH